jgi:hypothetical protein
VELAGELMPTATKTIDLNQPEAAREAGAELATSSAALVTQLGERPIVTVADLELAAEDRRTLGAAIGRVEEFFAPLKKMAYDLHRGLCSRENAILSPLRTLDARRAGDISAFKMKADAERRERERELGEQRRREDEARAVATAATLETEGEPEMAAAIISEAMAAPAPVVVLPDETRAAGVGFTRRWYWRFAGNDEARALRLVPREFLTLDTKKLGAYVRNMKDATRIPGIEVYYVDDPRR